MLLMHDPVQASQELAKDEAQIESLLHDFLVGYKDKHTILDRLQHGESITRHLPTLQTLLKNEIETITRSEKEEHEILRDLKYLSKDKYLQHVHELTTQVKTAQERDERLIELLEELSDLLKAQAHKVCKLVKTPDSQVEQELVNLMTIEAHIVENLAGMQSVEAMFSGIYKAEVQEDRISRTERRLAQQVLREMQQVSIDEQGIAQTKSDHYLATLTARILTKLKEKIFEAVTSGVIEEHPYVDVEFVNSKLFDDFVHEEVRADATIGQMVPSERTLTLFIRLFRNMYYAQQIPTKPF